MELIELRIFFEPSKPEQLDFSIIGAGQNTNIWNFNNLSNNVTVSLNTLNFSPGWFPEMENTILRSCNDLPIAQSRHCNSVFVSLKCSLTLSRLQVPDLSSSIPRP